MKKLILFLSILSICATSFAQYPSREPLNVFRLRTNSEETEWHITSTNDDTSEWFPLYAYQSIHYCFIDSGSSDIDSIDYKIELLVSSVNIDSAFQLLQTIVSSETSSGYRPPKIINVPPVPFGKIVLTGNTDNCVLPGLYGWIYVSGEKLKGER